MCRLCQVGYVPSLLCVELSHNRLDLLFLDKEEIIENDKIGDKLGASDHASIIVDVACAYQSIDTQQQRPIFYKADKKRIYNL